MKKSNKTLALAIGSTLIAGLSAGSAQANPFAMTDLSTGYMQVAVADTGTKKAPEAKCAGDKPMAAPKTAEAKCGEGKCGDGMKKPADEGKKAHTPKAAEAKCGEGKCGDGMKKSPEAKPAEIKKTDKK
jgi:uncharacterized low-complexity protein